MNEKKAKRLRAERDYAQKWFTSNKGLHEAWAERDALAKQVKELRSALEDAREWIHGEYCTGNNPGDPGRCNKGCMDATRALVNTQETKE